VNTRSRLRWRVAGLPGCRAATDDAAGDGVDRSPADHGLGHRGVAFVVEGQAAVRGNPAEGALDGPAAWDHRQPALLRGLAHDVQRGPQDRLGPAEELAGGPGVGEDEPHAGVVVGVEQDRLGAVAVLDPDR
jgi:hypothetical protein